MTVDLEGNHLSSEGLIGRLRRGEHGGDLGWNSYSTLPILQPSLPSVSLAGSFGQGSVSSGFDFGLKPLAGVAFGGINFGGLGIANFNAGLVRFGAGASGGGAHFGAAEIAQATAAATSAMKAGPLSVFDSQLTALYYQHSAGVATAAAMLPFTTTVQQFSNALRTDPTTHTQYVTVDIAAKDGNGAHLLHELNAIGFQHGASFGAVASGEIAVDKLGALLSVSDLGSAHEDGFTTNVGLVTNQSDHSLATDAVRSTYLGLQGAGITVGVISDSFNTSGNGSMATDIANNDLPGSATVYYGPNAPTTSILTDQSGGTDEGRAMAQIIHDEAPNANIIFDTGDGGQAAFAQHILDLAAAGCKVIVDDLTYFSEPDYQNGPIAQAIEQVESQGVIYLSSAGNDAQKGLEIHTPTHSGQGHGTGENLYCLSTGATPEFWGIHIPDGVTVTVTLQWAQPAYSADGNAHSTSDLDLYLFNSAGNSTLASNTGSNNQSTSDPITTLQYTNNTGSTLDANLAIGNAAGVDPKDIKITVFDDGAGTTVDSSTLNTNTGTVVGHHAANGSIAVAADYYLDSPTNNLFPSYESYTSGGPCYIYFSNTGHLLATPITRNAPLVTGIDGGDTSFFGSDTDATGFPNFYGTSAAAPSIAAVVALLLQADPSLTNADIQNVLADSCFDVGSQAGLPAGFDNLTGYGLVNASAAANSVETHTFVPQPLETMFLGTHENDTFAFDNLVFTGVAGQLARAMLVAGDSVSGGAGHDTVSLDGNYTGANAFVMNDTTILGVEEITLASGHSYSLTLADGNVAAGRSLLIDGSELGAGDRLYVKGSAETDGRFYLAGGSGNDTLSGGHGNDSLDGGRGSDRLTGAGGHDGFIYHQVSDSTGSDHDTIIGFDASADHFSFDTAVTSVNAAVHGGGLSTSSFDTNLAAAIGAGQLGAYHAVLFTPTRGTLHGHTFLVVDANGHAGYQAGQDFVIDVTGATHLASLSAADFV